MHEDTTQAHTRSGRRTVSPEEAAANIRRYTAQHLRGLRHGGMEHRRAAKALAAELDAFVARYSAAPAPAEHNPQERAAS